jgi:hypothetical protein
MTFETAENRYQRDPVFKGIKFEQRHPRPVMLRDMHAQFLDSISGARGESE